MILRMYSIFDSKAQAYLLPFFMPNNQMAERHFRDACTEDGHPFAKNPADYTLFYMGEWDENEGSVMPSRDKVALGNGVEYVAQLDASFTNIENSIGIKEA